ncbi:MULTISPECIES: hypothetical protein [Butyricimonas]|uniref:Uncharacterized protein n=1 Tax=Butyricimonas paravirosa TaxID=1472417 RepID=A0A7X5YB77_9BACT|nr:MULTISPECIES: hypothetical protein [Odoribacteraceae]NJC17529.1 hypothetical protein [Butyricimonas paravirosa]WOF14800.1 hypothetical protein F1644_22205 [Butyricimonas paravirosa]
MGTIRQEKGLPGFHADVSPGDHSQLPNGYETWAIRPSFPCRALSLLEHPRNSFRVAGYLVIFC